MAMNVNLFHSIRSVRHEGESRSQMRNWVRERMALKTHPKGSKGVYKDNLSWVAGVKVEIKKRKRI